MQRSRRIFTCAAPLLVCFALSCATARDSTDTASAADAGKAERSDAASCVTASARPQNTSLPADIIWVVDSSGSMADETDAVQTALNDFSEFIAMSGIDHRVILIGDAAEMSVPPPLGDSPRFLHVSRDVGSENALQHVHDSYSDYRTFLRPNAAVHLVVVTDDESEWTHQQFDAGLAGLTDPGLSGYTLHAICSAEEVSTPPPPLPPIPIVGPCSGGFGAGGAEAVGQTYIDMVAATGGVWRSICETNWQPIFDAVAEAVTVSVALPCSYVIPALDDGDALDPDRVNFIFTASTGVQRTIPRVDSLADCSPTDGGWYYDDSDDPQQVIACPATCDLLTADDSGMVDIEFGCTTIVR